jgi:hypothetical protein
LAMDLNSARTLRVVASANLSNEELFLARELFVGHLRAELVVPSFPGEPRRMKNAARTWLAGQEAHPNAGGARRLGLTVVDQDGLARFLYGAADITVILDTAAHPFLATREALQLLRVGASVACGRIDHPVKSVVRWLLPTTSIACNEGTFTSSTGAVGRFAPAFAPPVEARPLWLVLAALARQLWLAECDFETPAQVFAAVVASGPAFAGLSWDTLGAADRPPEGERQHVG